MSRDGTNWASLADRQRIAQVLVAYARALDAGDWDGLERCFTADATTDYGEFGGGNANRDEIVDTCRTAMAPIEAGQHLTSNVLIEVEGEASAVSYVRA